MDGRRGIEMDWPSASAYGRVVADEVAEEFAGKVARRAAVLAPYRTGHLSRGHRVVKVRTGQFVVVNIRGYSLPVHEGHRIVVYGNDTGRRTRPRRWLTRATDEVMSRWQ